MKAALIFLLELIVLGGIVLGFIWTLNVAPGWLILGLFIVLVLMYLRRWNAHTGG